MTEDDANRAKQILDDLDTARSLNSTIHRLYKEAKENVESREKLANIASQLADKWESSLLKELRDL